MDRLPDLNFEVSFHNRTIIVQEKQIPLTLPVRVCRYTKSRIMNLRPNRWNVQTQRGLPERTAFCGLFSINNTMKEPDFISIAEMIPILQALRVTHPTEDHGDEVNGHYSVMAMQMALRPKGYNLIYLNKMPFLKKHRRDKWYERLADTTFKRVIIIGRPQGQRAGISHCIAKVSMGDKTYLVCPDEGERKLCSEKTLYSFLPTLEGAYAIVSHEELVEMHARKEIRAGTTF